MTNHDTETRQAGRPPYKPLADPVRWAATPAGEITLGSAFLFLLTLAMFAGVLFGPGDVVLSNLDTDLAKQFVHWRAFGFGELRAGHLALWNPHIFSGAPYFGGFQSALLYPPNWLYLVLPLGRAINAGIALHVFLAGLFMFFWTRGRGLHGLACVFAGVLFMFCGPYFPHIYAGHLPNLCAMVWAPLLFLAIDGWLVNRTMGWPLLGAGVVAMQILAGHPQYVFYTGVAAAIYCGLHLWNTPRPVRALAGLAAMVVGAVGLSAVQLFEGFHAAGVSARSVGTTMEFAGMFSFPPENFLTLLVPGFFGDMTNSPYWGRCYLWEMSLFIGISGLVLAVYGALRGERKQRRFCAGLVAVLMVAALGSHTPLFRWLYLYAPGFNKFRGWSKFTFPAILFTIMLAAVGFDRILRRGPVGRGVGLATVAGGIALLGAAGWAFASSHPVGIHGPQPWSHWMQTLDASGEQLALAENSQKPDFVLGAARFAAGQLLLAGVTALALGAALLTARKHPQALWAVFGIGVIEMVVFAWSSFDTMRLDDAVNTLDTDFLRGQPGGDYRILNKDNPNLAMSIGARDLWGYDPGVLLRYAEWMQSSQGRDADDPSQTLRFDDLPPVYASLLRCRYVLDLKTNARGEEKLGVVQLGPPQGTRHVRLISDFRVLTQRDEIFAAMRDPAFDPGRTVILETRPDPSPDPGDASGMAEVIAETSDSLTIEANLPKAAVLLVSDTYCTGWQARSLLPAATNAQTRYTVVPADYCLRAIPMAAGHHRLLLEYRPRAFVIGCWTTATALIVYAVLIVYFASSRGWFSLPGRPTRRVTPR